MIHEKLSYISQKWRNINIRIGQRFLKIIFKFFPSPEIAIGSACELAPVSPERVISNYYQGMVLFGEDNLDQLVWEIFSERAIVTPETANIPKRLQGILRKQPFEIRYNTNFEEVIRSCQRDKTWINEPLIQVYQELFQKGCVKTIETYQNDCLVGGVWGLVVNRNFGLMSMFHRENHAGAIALATLVDLLKNGKYHLIDCGKLNDNFARYGAVSVSYEEFVERLAQSHF